MFAKHLRRARSRTPRPPGEPATKTPTRRPRLEALEDRCLLSGDVVLRWNEILLQSLPSQPPRVPLSRNLALVHVAMFDAVNAIERSYTPYYAEVQASHGASREAAAAQAAHDTLVALYPARQAIYDSALAEDLAGIPPGLAMQGVAIGQEVARQILELRSNDGSNAIMSWVPPNNDPGVYQLTPPNFAPAGNVHVPFITPFATESTSQFRPGPPPALTSPEYAADVNEVKTLGVATGSSRTPDQTLVAGLWRVPLTNHTVWNRVAQDIAAERGTSIVDTARLFALLNMSLNDGLQTSNESKYHYELWRPVTAIRRADEDGNPATEADPGWITLHPTTPPYPAYASNASAIGAACATVLAGVFGADVPIEIDWTQYGFPGVTRSYESFWAAADEMANSRIYGGIHFRFDCVAGQEIGVNVGEYVVDNYLLPRKEGQGGGWGPGGSKSGELTAPGSVAPPASAGLDLFPGRVLDIGVAGLPGALLGPGGLRAIWLGANAAGWRWSGEATSGGGRKLAAPADLLTVSLQNDGDEFGRLEDVAIPAQSASDGPPAAPYRVDVPIDVADWAGAADPWNGHRS